MTYPQGSLKAWLDKIASLHPQEMALGLERVKEVAQRLWTSGPDCPVIIVGGTNGKGSCVASIEQVYLAQGYRTGVFNSPILWRHNEYVRIDGKEANDDLFCQAYSKIESTRGELSLTPFEYHCLAALDMFRQLPLDVWILEVGLGGRLDAVNIVDADVAVIASIGIDHAQWLGNTREEIGYEKAGIFRQGKPVVYGEPNAPQSLLNRAKELQSPLYQLTKAFSYSQQEESWTWQTPNKKHSSLPLPQLALQNVSSALMVIELLQGSLPVSLAAMQKALKNLSLPGRQEIFYQPILHVIDVAHNPDAVAFLAQRLKTLVAQGKCRAVFSMLGDKDIAGSIREIKEQIAEWYIAPLLVRRGATEDDLLQAAEAAGVQQGRFFSSVADAYAQALRDSASEDCVVIFGSFHTVSQVLVDSKT